MLLNEADMNRRDILNRTICSFYLRPCPRVKSFKILKQANEVRSGSRTRFIKQISPGGGS